MAKNTRARFPRMIRGSVVVQRRRCGKQSCRCTDGTQLHESTVLSYSAAGRNKTLMLAADEVAPVRAAVERYRAAQSALEAEGNSGLEALTERVAAQRADRRRGR
jgi:hypothetical protein